jgi:hypothetical protein
MRAGAKPVEIPTAVGNADYRYVEMAAFDHGLQGGFIAVSSLDQIR